MSMGRLCGYRKLEFVAAVFVELLPLLALWVRVVGHVLHPKQSAVYLEELWSWLGLMVGG